ncbi:MAG: type II and III secretion system protein [Planctomycetes bacterium]|nr:type II and III secretion system protein [Planctomycetota bacterium]
MSFRLVPAFLLVAAIAASAQDAPPTPPPDQPPQPPPPTFTYQRGKIEKDGMVWIFYQVGHNRGPLIQPFLQKFMSPKGSIQVAPPQPPGQSDLHLMMISDVKENIELIEKVLNILDRPLEQVAIEAQIIEKAVSNDLEIGAELSVDQTKGRDEFFRSGSAVFNPDAFLSSLAPGSQPYQGTTFNFFNHNQQWGIIEFKIRALVRKGRAKVLSSPYVTVNNGETATIVAGDDVPFVEFINVVNGIPNSTIRFKQAAVKLTVTPHVVGGSYIDLDVKPEVTSVTGSVNIAGNPTPVFSTRNADTHLTVQDGQQIVIGGLVRTEEVETRRGLPLLSDIPIIGYLFGSTNLETKKTEILFIMRPRILKAEAAKELLIPGGPK